MKHFHIYQPKQSKLALGIADAELDTLSMEEEPDEVGFSTQIGGTDLAEIVSDASNSLATTTTTSSSKTMTTPSPQLLRTHKKKHSQAGEHPSEFYIGYLKDRVEREHESVRQRQLRAQQTNRRLKTSFMVGRKTELVEPRTAYSSPDLSTPILRPLMCNRFRLKTQSSMNNR